jgi:hypothetical protein
MPSAANSAEPRLSRWETLGAWLHIWTPPKGLDVPPVPWRRLAVWGAVAVVVVGIAAAIAVPRIDEGKKQGAAERAAASLKADNAERARLRADQKVHRLKVSAGLPLLPMLETAITADAKTRADAGTIDGQVLGTSCEPAGPHAVRFPGSRVFKCFVKTAAGIPGQGKDVLSTGYPFVATIYGEARQLAWCKQNPHADEKGMRGDVRVKLSPLCAGKLRAVL